MKFYPGDKIRCMQLEALVLTEPDISNIARVKTLNDGRECIWDLCLCSLVEPVRLEFRVGDQVSPRAGVPHPYPTIRDMLKGKVIYVNSNGGIDIRILQHPLSDLIQDEFHCLDPKFFIHYQSRNQPIVEFRPPNEYEGVDIQHWFLPGEEVVIDPATWVNERYTVTSENMITGEVVEMMPRITDIKYLRIRIAAHKYAQFVGKDYNVDPFYFKLKNPIPFNMFNENDIICFNPESTGGKEIYKYINSQMREAQVLEMREDGRLLRIQVLAHEDPSKVGYQTLVDAKYFTRLREAEKFTVTLITGEEVTYSWREHRILKSGKYALKSDSSVVQIQEKWYHPSEFEAYNIIMDHHTGKYNFMAGMLNGVVDTRGSIGFFSGNVIQYSIVHTDEDGYGCDPLFLADNDLPEELFQGRVHIYFLGTEVADHYEVLFCPALDRYIHRSQWQERIVPRSQNQYRFGYHALSDKNFSSNSLYRIGVEVEKEDAEALVLATADEMYNKYGWRKEKDGSLNVETGFEFISPIYDLEDANGRMAQDFANEVIAQHLNAAWSERCGGHINLSCKTESAAHLCKSIEGYLPLLYAMYPKRVGANFCKAKPKKEYQYADKYSAIHIKGQRTSPGSILEFRIFPAIRTVKQLEWRIELIRLMLKYKTSSPKQVIKYLSSEKSELHKHLRKIYAEPEMIMERIKRMYKYMAEIDNETVPAPEIEKVITQYQNKNIPMYVLAD